MDIKLKKSKMAAGVVSWFAGIVILSVNILGMLAEMGCYGNYPEHVKEVMFGDYQDTEEFRDYVLIHMSNFLSMSVAEDSTEDQGTAYWDMEDWGVQEDGAEPWEDWEQEMGIAEEATGTMPEADYSTDNYPSVSSGRTYYYSDYFTDIYGDRYDVVYRDWGMSKEAAEEIHDRLRYDTNILYRVENKGQVLYSNYEHLGEANEDTQDYYSADIDSGVDGEAFRFVVPEGYNYILYYDGEKMRVWKNGSEIRLDQAEYRMENDWYIPGYGNTPADDFYRDSRVYMVVAHTPGIIVKRNFDGNGNTYYSNQLYNIRMRYADVRAYYRSWLWSTFFALALIAAGVRLRVYRKEAYRIIAGVTGRIWFEIKLIPVAGVLLLGLKGMVSFLQFLGWREADSFYEIYYGTFQEVFYGIRGLLGSGSVRLVLLMAMAAGCAGVLWLFFNDIRYNRRAWEKSVAREAAGLFRTSMFKLSLSKRIVWYSLGVFLQGIMYVFIFAMAFMEIRGGTEGWLLFVILSAGILFIQFLGVRAIRRMAADMDSLAGQIAAVHRGDLQESPRVSEGSGLAEAMEELNDIRDGMDRAVREQMKSERMKVELIANVSHDIKTPLTSIISYVELLKQEDGMPEHVKEYVSILESKSQRLKAMVRDVFEVSKAASGELPVHMENLDLGKLIRQTVADMQEEIERSQVGVRCDMPEGAVMIHADGDRLYRVFQNLIQNALKYSLEGSRIYIHLQVKEGEAVADVKNTSKEELPPDMDFTERFIRGDKSRTDGGSGLGLSIAQSFTEACGGSFRVETIADLFVVTVAFQCQ